MKEESCWRVGSRYDAAIRDAERLISEKFVNARSPRYIVVRVQAILGGKISGIAWTKYRRQVSLSARWSRLAGSGRSVGLSVVVGEGGAVGSESLVLISSGRPLSAVENGGLDHLAFLRPEICF